MDALRLSARRRRRRRSSRVARSRRVALCRLLLAEARRAAARRADEPSRCGVRGVARALPARRIQGTVVAITHDRYFLDNAAGWILELDRGSGHPVGGQLQLELARPEAGAPGQQEEKQASRRARSTLARELEWVRLSPRARQVEEQGAHQPRTSRSLATRRRSASRSKTVEIYDPARSRASATVVIQVEGLKKGYGEQPADRRSLVLAPARRASSA